VIEKFPNWLQYVYHNLYKVSVLHDDRMQLAELFTVNFKAM